MYALFAPNSVLQGKGSSPESVEQAKSISWAMAQFFIFLISIFEFGIAFFEKVPPGRIKVPPGGALKKFLVLRSRKICQTVCFGARSHPVWRRVKMQLSEDEQHVPSAHSESIGPEDPRFYFVCRRVAFCWRMRVIVATVGGNSYQRSR